MRKTLILKLKESKLPRLVILSKTRHITEEDIEIHSAWEYLSDGYKQIEQDLNVDWEDKALHSILNSIVYQQRIYFCFEREKVRSLLSGDKNWSKGISLDNNKYRYMIEELIKKEIIELHDDTKKPHIYKVIHPDVLDMIKVDDEETQLSQVIDFRDKNKKNNYDNKTDGKTDGKTDVDKEIIRKVEKQTESATENNSCLVEKDSSDVSKDKEVTFESLLFIQHPDEYPSFDDIPFLAQLAVENCQDFDAGYSDIGTFEKHLKKMYSKPSAKQKKFMADLVEKFDFEAKKAYNLAQSNGVELREPTELKNKALKNDANSEDATQQNRLNMLKACGVAENVRVLKSRLVDASEEEKAMIKAEIQYWENI